MLLADRGYDADWIRALVTKRRAWANIPPRSNRNEPICFSPHLYRARNLVERFFNKIKQCRRVATRYDKLAANYLAFVQLASIRLWLRVKPQCLPRIALIIGAARSRKKSSLRVARSSKFLWRSQHDYCPADSSRAAIIALKMSSTSPPTTFASALSLFY